MKNIISFIIASASLVFGLTSCSKDNLGMEDIFNGNDKTVVAPLDFQATLGDETYNVISQYIDFVMQKNSTEVVTGIDCSMLIINRKDQLEGVVDYEGKPIVFPEIDLERYSIVIGGAKVVQGTYSIANQRVVVKDNVIKYYIEITENQEVGNCWPCTVRFSSLYEKLPQDRSAEIVKWVH